MKLATKPLSAQKRQLSAIFFDRLEVDERKHLDQLLREFDNGADLESRNEFGQTALILAAEHGWTKLARELITRGADVNAATPTGRNALHWGARHEVTAASILKAGANTRATDRNGETPLHRAVLWGSIALSQKLIDTGADVNAVSSTLGSPLHTAIRNDHDDCARALIKAGASNDIKHKGVTPAGLAGRLKKKGLADEIRAYAASAKAVQVVEMMMRAHGLMNGSRSMF